MSTLLELFYDNPNHYTSKFIHYLLIYDELFSKYRNKEVSVLEIGIASGGSLELWKTYFGAKAKIYGIDLDSKAPYLENASQITLFKGNQNDRKFLKYVKQEVPHIDIIIDDGSHLSQDQIVTFEEMFMHINSNGLYIIEDLHNAWHPNNTGISFPNYISALTHRMFSNTFKTEEFIEFIVQKQIIKSVNCYQHLICIEKYPMGQYLISPVRTGHE